MLVVRASRREHGQREGGEARRDEREEVRERRDPAGQEVPVEGLIGVADLEDAQRRALLVVVVVVAVGGGSANLSIFRLEGFGVGELGADVAPETVPGGKDVAEAQLA